MNHLIFNLISNKKIIKIMRQLFIVNANGSSAPTVKGGFAFNFKGSYVNIAADLPSAPAVNDVIEMVNSLGNGSIKTFTFNPFNFNFVAKDSGADVADQYSFSFPSGSINPVTDYVTGGIVISKWDSDKNVLKTLKLIPISLSTSLWSDVRVAVVTALTAASTYFVGHGANGQSDTYTTTMYDLSVTFTGDLTGITVNKIFGGKEAITGVDVAKFERELAPNMGANNTVDKAEYFADSNFIADTTVNYDVITLTTKTEAQRDLVKGSDGFVKTVHIYTKSDAGGKAIKTALVGFLTKLKADPTGQSIV